MEELKISETAREKLEDAAVSVFMEEYAKALNAGLDQQMEASAAEEFPKELEERCLALIRKETAKQRNQKRKKNALRVLRSAAAVVLVLLSVSSILFMSVEAFRLPIINFFVEKTDRYWQLSGVENEDTAQDVFDPKDPLDGIILDEFVITSITGSWDSECLIVEYSNGNNAVIDFIAVQNDGNVQIDTEDANVVQHKVFGHDAVKSIKENYVRITWLDETNSKIITLCSTNVSEEMTLLYADAVAKLLN